MVWSEYIRYIAIYILSCRVHSIYCDIFCPAERVRYMACRLTSDISKKDVHHYLPPINCTFSSSDCFYLTFFRFWEDWKQHGAVQPMSEWFDLQQPQWILKIYAMESQRNNIYLKTRVWKEKNVRWILWRPLTSDSEVNVVCVCKKLMKTIKRRQRHKISNERIPKK